MKLENSDNKQILQVALTTPLWKFIEAYQQNKGRIDHALATREGLNDDTKVVPIVFGLALGPFLIALFIALALYIWAVVVLVKYWKAMPSWASITGLVALLLGLPFITIILAYVAKK